MMVNDRAYKRQKQNFKLPQQNNDARWLWLRRFCLFAVLQKTPFELREWLFSRAKVDECDDFYGIRIKAVWLREEADADIWKQVYPMPN